MRKKPAAFPVGLYSMLLFALCWLTLPAVFAPVERWLVGCACLVPRTLSAWFGEPAAARAPEAQQRLQELSAELRRRIAEHDVAGASKLLPATYEPICCAVLDAPRDKARRGGGGQPGELRLDHSYAEVDGCCELVTKGNALLGFLQRPGVGIADGDRPQDPARVMLCNHRAARPVYAEMSMPEGAAMHLVVAAAAAVDPAPLRADLWEDPYRAARLGRGGQPVHTETVADATVLVPSGLELGRTRVWGYEQHGADEAVAIGVYVVPPVEPRALSFVVLWRQAAGPRAAGPPELRSGQVQRLPATVYDLPGVAYGRHLLVVGQAVPDGAAVVDNGLFLGTARGLAFGTGLMTSFIASRHRWSLILMPDDPRERPRELEGEILRTEHDDAWLRWCSDRWSTAHERLLPGYLFTGSNGACCPAGLWIGRAEPHPYEHDLLRVTTPRERGPRAAQVLVAGGRT